MASVLTETQEAALRATARLACVAAIAGCGSKAPPAATATPAGAGGAASTETVGESAPEALASPFVTDEQKQCAATVDEAMKAREGRGPESVSPDTQACCKSLLEVWEDARKEGLLGEWEHQWACCEVVDFSTPFCTPWGPPAPPAMPDELA